MQRLLIIHCIFLIVALFIAFAVVPADLMYFNKGTDEEISYYYYGAITFKNFKPWGITFTWFLGLTCGRLIFRAFMK